MIQHPRPGTMRRRSGFAIMAVLIGGAVSVAQAAVKQDAGGIQASPPVVGIVSWPPPPHPESAVTNNEEGTVVVTALVGTDRQPSRIVSVRAHEAAPDLIQAASDSVLQHWRFQPALKSGEPRQGYPRVPINFKLRTPAPTPSSTAPAASSASSRT